MVTTSSPPAPAPFTSVPVLPLAKARDPATKPEFLADLRAALLNGYLSSFWWPYRINQTQKFFKDLPFEEKEKIEMKNEKSFLGWSRLDNEITARQVDHREQLDLSTTHPIPPPTAPLYQNLRAPNQWPSPAYLPDFRSVFEDYIRRLSDISTFFTSLIAEAIGLPVDSFNNYFDEDQQHKLKVVKYPEVDLSRLSPTATEKERSAAQQGVGPHKDSMLTTYLLQASPQRGLQAQNQAGNWIDVTPIPNTLVVVIGQGMEALTGGVCASTTHRVLSPNVGDGARFSVPFFQGVSWHASFEEMPVPQETKDLSEELRRQRGGRNDDVEFTFVKGRWENLGEATLMNRVKSHPDVGQRWYPDLLDQIRSQQAVEALASA